MRPERPLVLHERLPQLQQLGVLLGVDPPQVLHMLDHHLHCFTDAALLKVRGVSSGESHNRRGGGKGACEPSDLVDGAQHLRATGHSGHGLDEDVQVLLEPLDDFHGLVVIITQRNQGLKSERHSKNPDGGQPRVNSVAGGPQADLPAASPGSWRPPCGRSPRPGRVIFPPVSVSSPA